MAVIGPDTPGEVGGRVSEISSVPASHPQHTDRKQGPNNTSGGPP